MGKYIYIFDNKGATHRNIERRQQKDNNDKRLTERKDKKVVLYIQILEHEKTNIKSCSVYY